MGAEPSAWRLGALTATPDGIRRDAAAYVHRNATSPEDEQHLLDVLGLTDTTREDNRGN